MRNNVSSGGVLQTFVSFLLRVAVVTVLMILISLGLDSASPVVWMGVFGVVMGCILALLVWSPARKKLGFGLMLVGGTSNMLAIGFNLAKMPVYYITNAASLDSRHSIATASTRLPLLCDRINLGVAIASYGDFLLLAGFIYLIIINIHDKVRCPDNLR